MKKENKKLAQEQRAKERKKQATKDIIKNVFKFGIPALAVILLVVLIIVDPFSVKKDSASSTSTDTESTLHTPKALDENLTYYADIKIEDYGTITVKLDQKSAPITAANFVELAEDGFYDGLTFHRIIKEFMMQGGDPEATGSGGAGYNITGEFTSNGHDNKLSHTKGAISMARSQSYDSASSQFFIVHEDSTHLDGNYAAFGYVTEGMDIVNEICETIGKTDSEGAIDADKQPVITSITIRTE